MTRKQARTDSENRVDVVHGLCPDVGELLDLLRHVLDLVVGQHELELLHSRLDLRRMCTRSARCARARIQRGRGDPQRSSQSADFQCRYSDSCQSPRA